MPAIPSHEKLQNTGRKRAPPRASRGALKLGRLLAGLLPSFKGAGRVVTGSSLGMQTLLSGGPGSALWESPWFLPLWTDRKRWPGASPPFLALVRCESGKGAVKDQSRPSQGPSRPRNSACAPWERRHLMDTVAAGLWRKESGERSPAPSKSSVGRLGVKEGRPNQVGRVKSHTAGRKDGYFWWKCVRASQLELEGGWNGESRILISTTCCYLMLALELGHLVTTKSWNGSCGYWKGCGPGCRVCSFIISDFIWLVDCSWEMCFAWLLQ